MAEFVRKTALGYKQVAEGSFEPEYTHVILTEGEYAELQQELSNARQAAINAKRAAGEAIYDARLEAQSRRLRSRARS